MSGTISSPWVRLTIALLALGAACAGEWWLVGELDTTRAAWAWGITAILAALLMLDGEARLLPEPEAPLEPKTEAALFIGLMIVGIFFAVHRLDILPSGLNHDVAWNGLYGLRILHGEKYTPYVSEAWGRETLMFYFQALGIKLYGPEVFAMIAPAIVNAIIMLPLAYWWTRELFGPRLALLATFLLAVSGWHLVFGRIGWRASIQPTFSLIGYLFMVRAFNTGGLWSFALAGIGAAAPIYTYNAARLVPGLYPLYIAYRFLISPDRRAFLKKYWRGLGLLAITFTVTVFPMAYYAATHWIQWQGRADATFFMEGRTLWGNIANAALLYPYYGNGDDFFIRTPLLEYPAAVLLGFGMLRALCNPRDARGMFLLLGFLVNIVPGVLTNPNGNRAIGTLPFVYVFVALGADLFVRSLRAVPALGRGLAAAFLVVLCISSTYATYYQYLGVNRRELFGFYPETTVLGRYMKTLVPDYSIWVGGANFPRDTLTYLTYNGGDDPERRNYTWLDDITQLPRMELYPERGKGLALIVANFDRGPLIFEELTREYPKHEVVELQDWSHDNQVFAKVLLVPKDGERAGVPIAPVAPAAPADLFGARRGTAAGEFMDPKAIAIGPSGDVYVADTGNHRLQRFSKDGTLLATWGAHGATPGNYDEPNDVAVGKDGVVYVVDTWNHRVQKLSADGQPLGVVQPPNGFFGPRGIAIGPDRIYVTDTGNNNIAVFDSSGAYIGRFGGKGSGPGELLQPVSMALTKERTLWVVDGGNNRLQEFGSDGHSLRTVAVPGWESDSIKEASVIVTDDGTLYLAEPQNGLILKLNAEGALVPVADGLRGPTGIAKAPDGLYVTERPEGRVVKVKPTS